MAHFHVLRDHLALQDNLGVLALLNKHLDQRAQVLSERVRAAARALDYKHGPVVHISTRERPRDALLAIKDKLLLLLTDLFVVP